MKRVLTLLLAYKGPHSFAVGETIAGLVRTYGGKYPVLWGVMDQQERPDYSFALKQIAFCLVLGLPVRLSPALLARCRAESHRNNKMAAIFLRAVVAHSRVLETLTEGVGSEMVSVPGCGMEMDPYMCLI